MTWVKLDDHIADNPTILRVPRAARWVLVEGLCYCSRHLTDGFIPTEAAGPSKEVAAVVAAGLWSQVEGGYQVRNYLDYQPSRAKVLAEREAARVRKNGRRGSGELPANVAEGSSSPLPAPVLSVVTSAAAVPEVDATPEQQQRVSDLLAALHAAGMRVTRRGLSKDNRLLAVAVLINTHGIPALVASAAGQWNPNNPAGSIVAFLDGWAELRPPAVAVPSPCPLCSPGDPCDQHREESA